MSATDHQSEVLNGVLAGLRERATASRSNIDFHKVRLREKFIIQLFKYLGTPYSKRFCDPAYESDFFLDCCGFIRLVMDELRHDFGFRIGRFNQCYMFDTLPLQRTCSTAEPGDIIFLQGKYHEHLEDFKDKVFPHDILHVEVFLGGASGTQSIASRRLTGVALHETYRVPGDANAFYRVEDYCFRSLDTWLNGVCKSFCKEHLWLPRALSTPQTPSSKSSRSSKPTLSQVGKSLFKPGDIGIAYHAETGKITSVKPGSQADSAGVMAGMFMSFVGDASYSREKLKEAICGTKDYNVVFNT